MTDMRAMRMFMLAKWGFSSVEVMSWPDAHRAFMYAAVDAEMFLQEEAAKRTRSRMANTKS